MEKGTSMSNNEMKTRAFEVVDNKNTSRRKVVIAIFVAVALILVSFLVLIIGKVATQLPEQPITPSNKNMIYIPKEASEIKTGNLLSINDNLKYEMPSSFDNMVNLYEYRKNSDNVSKTEINGAYTYSLSLDRIALDNDTLDAFNQMIIDYCKTLDLSNANVNSASNIVVAWGGYTQSTIDEYSEDVTNIGKDYYDHALGTTLTLKKHTPSVAITEDILKNEYKWIYENAHKYGFILRYPNACKDHTGFDGNARVHLRYVGVEHATYIFNNNICFENYLEILRNKHNSPEKALSITTQNGSFSVYYVKYTGNPTSVPIPKNATYTISGDNMNGFIVTVEK